MSRRMPASLAHDAVSSRVSATVHEATVQEIAQEKAAALGRAGRRLEDALNALTAFDAAPHHPADRERLLTAAGEALFFYVVQREACGLRDTPEILRELAVPVEVQLRMGYRRRSTP